jgi:hypothetical protein
LVSGPHWENESLKYQLFEPHYDKNKKQREIIQNMALNFNPRLDRKNFFLGRELVTTDLAEEPA